MGLLHRLLLIFWGLPSFLVNSGLPLTTHSFWKDSSTVIEVDSRVKLIIRNIQFTSILCMIELFVQTTRRNVKLMIYLRKHSCSILTILATSLFVKRTVLRACAQTLKLQTNKNLFVTSFVNQNWGILLIIFIRLTNFPRLIWKELIIRFDSNIGTSRK